MNWYTKLLMMLLLAVQAATMLSCGQSGSSSSSDEEIELIELPPPIRNTPVPVSSSLTCPTGTQLSWENFGQAFMLNYCTSCHSAELSGSDRVGAPEEMNFDSLQDVMNWRMNIHGAAAVEQAIMPPSKHVGADEKALLTEWLGCGAPADR
jgi:hypothetical protein